MGNPLQQTAVKSKADTDRYLQQVGAKLVKNDPDGSKLYQTRQKNFCRVTPRSDGNYTVTIANRACNC